MELLQKLRGTGVALVTPFNNDYSVDYDGLRKLLDFVIQGKVEYLVVNGTTGESVTTNADEKKEILAFVKKHVGGKIPIVFGIGGNNTYGVIDTIKATDLEGVSAILSVSPYYNKPSQQGIIQHFTAIADACPVPVILYNVPGRTSSNITAETTLKLAHHNNIIGIKEASGNLEQCMKIVKERPANFLAISGDDMLTIPMLSFGMDGVISVLANGFPGKFTEMIRLGLDQNFKKASEIMMEFVDINPLMYEESNPVGVKAVLDILGICKSTVRLPLVEASSGLSDRIQKLL